MKLERVVADLIERVERRFYGKYRGLVVDNQDPAHLGRLRMRVPSVLGADVVTGWAMPCAPYGGSADAGFLAIPEIGSGVWTEFEEGDLEFPIWVGTFWSAPQGSSELPKPHAADGSEQGSVQDPPTAKIIKTKKGHVLQMEDADGAEMLLLREGPHGHVITMDATGITVKDANGNRATFSDQGIVLADDNDNSVAMTDSGITATDGTGNTITMSSTSFTLTAKVPLRLDASGQTVTIIGSAINLQQGDAMKRLIVEGDAVRGTDKHNVKGTGPSSSTPPVTVTYNGVGSFTYTGAMRGGLSAFVTLGGRAAALVTSTSALDPGETDPGGGHSGPSGSGFVMAPGSLAAVPTPPTLAITDTVGTGVPNAGAGSGFLSIGGVRVLLDGDKIDTCDGTGATGNSTVAASGQAFVSCSG